MNSTKQLSPEEHEYAVKLNKELRRDLDEILAKLPNDSRERSLAVTKIQEGMMWLGMDLKRLGETNPYPNSKTPENTTIDKTADGLQFRPAPHPLSPEAAAEAELKERTDHAILHGQKITDIISPLTDSDTYSYAFRVKTSGFPEKVEFNLKLAPPRSNGDIEFNAEKLHEFRSFHAYLKTHITNRSK